MTVQLRFPFPVKAWKWWCDNGFKRASGGTLAGSFLQRHLRAFYTKTSSRSFADSYIKVDQQKHLYVDSLDAHTYQMILPQLQSVDEELILAQVLTPKAGVFIDVGANVGLLSLHALSATIAEVHSFEPNPAMIARLEKTRTASPYAQQWHLHTMAVGAAISNLPLYIEPTFSGTASLQKRWQNGDKEMINVPVTTLDHWCQAHKFKSIDVLKMDVEGWEAAVLEGATEMLSTYKPYLWFEHNLPVLKRCQLDPEQVLERLESAGYHTYFDIANLSKQHSLSRTMIKNWPMQRINLLAVPEQRMTDLCERVLPAFQKLDG